MDSDATHMVAGSKVPMLKPREFELWRMRIEQYIQMIDYALWDVTKNENSILKTQTVNNVKAVIPPTTAEAKLQRKNEKRFGGNDATNKTQRNLLKQQYENFSRSSSKSLDQTFDKLQNLVSQLELLRKIISQEDINQKFLRSFPSEWGMHVVVWRNKLDLDTLSMDDLYNNLKIYESKVKGISSSTNIQKMSFVSSSPNNSNNSNGVNTTQGDNTANRVNTASS
nr:hypothetical protein [Tanacetum cinerariifolium]